MTFFDFCEPSIEILLSFCLFRETPEIPDKIQRFVHMRQRREEDMSNIDTVIIVAYAFFVQI